jgi:hypothetical protein
MSWWSSCLYVMPVVHLAPEFYLVPHLLGDQIVSGPSGVGGAVLPLTPREWTHLWHENKARGRSIQSAAASGMASNMTDTSRSRTSGSSGSSGSKWRGRAERTVASGLSRLGTVRRRQQCALWSSTLLWPHTQRHIWTLSSLVRSRLALCTDHFSLGARRDHGGRTFVPMPIDASVTLSGHLWTAPLWTAPPPIPTLGTSGTTR